MDLVRFAPDSQRLVAATNGGVAVWEEITPNGRPTSNLDYASPNFVRFTPDGRKLIFLAYQPQEPEGRRSLLSGEVLVFHDLTSDTAETLFHEGDYVFGSCDCTPDGRFVLLVVTIVSFGAGHASRQSQTTISCRRVDA